MSKKEMVKITPISYESYTNRGETRYGLVLDFCGKEKCVLSTKDKVDSLLENSRLGPSVLLSLMYEIFEDDRYLFCSNASEGIDLDGLRVVWDEKGLPIWEQDTVTTDHEIYQLMTHEEEVLIVEDLLSELSSEEILALPGTWEIFREHFNNTTLDTFVRQYKRRNNLC